MGLGGRDPPSGNEKGPSFLCNRVNIHEGSHRTPSFPEGKEPQGRKQLWTLDDLFILFIVLREIRPNSSLRSSPTEWRRTAKNRQILGRSRRHP